MRVLSPVPGEFFSNTFSQLQVPLLMWDKNAERWLGGEKSAAQPRDAPTLCSG